jgi:hypothetical protein
MSARSCPNSSLRASRSWGLLGLPLMARPPCTDTGHLHVPLPSLYYLISLGGTQVWNTGDCKWGLDLSTFTRSRLVIPREPLTHR